MERNWLIRTSQNQILGPVSKEKIVEFITKGALGLTDEISSGNGYWFYIKEKDLLERYVFGDVPQSYNPISEAKTVLARQENPDLTGSLNVSPANREMKQAESSEDAHLPNQDDLEFPDITTVINLDSLKSKESKESKESKIETAPVDHDQTIIHQTSLKTKNNDLQFEIPEKYQAKKKESETPEEISLPKDEDLEFPTLSDITPDKTVTKINPNEDLDVNRNFTRTVAIKSEQKEEVLTLEVKNREIPKKTPPANDKKLLHERKTKPVLKKTENLRDPKREQAYKHKEKEEPKRNDSYLFFILILLILIIGSVLYYFKEILNKPLPV